MSKFKVTQGYRIIENWMAAKGQEPFLFQEQTWQKYANGYSGLVVAPTGFGKTFSLFLGVIIQHLNNPLASKKDLN